MGFCGSKLRDVLLKQPYPFKKPLGISQQILEHGRRIPQNYLALIRQDDKQREPALLQDFQHEPALGRMHQLVKV